MKLRPMILAAVLAANAASVSQSHAADDNISEGAFAVAGACTVDRRVFTESASALATALITQVVTQSVQSFASALSSAAQGRTEETSVALLIEPRHATQPRSYCIQFIRGGLQVNARQEDMSRALRGMMSDNDAQALASALYANGARFSEPPELLVEARLTPIRQTGEATRLFVLDPTLIAYREPSFRQRLRFWDRDERHFALQLQLAEAPDVPGAGATGGNALLGAYQPGASASLVGPNPRERGPRGSYAFQLSDAILYNARVSVAESSSASEFARFWATAISAPAVQHAAVSDINQAVNPQIAATNEAALDGIYGDQRSALNTKISACPRTETDAAHDWLRQERHNLVRAVVGFNRAARTLRRDGITGFASNAGLTEVIAWCGQARTFLETH